jgi:hypothetical protein
MKRSSFNTKRQGPDGKIHEGWCAIFAGEGCSCNDDDHKKLRRRRPGPLSGAPPAKKHLEEV